MKVWFVRIFAFLFKEIHEIRRQPRLLLSLIGGPFMVLALFGATFESANPVVSIVLVWPESGIPGVKLEQVQRMVDRNFDLKAIISDREEALKMLERGQVEAVQIIPNNVVETVQAGGRPKIEVYSRVIDPTAEQWVRTLALSEVNYINRLLLLSQTGRAQSQALSIQIELRDAQGLLASFEDTITPERRAQARQTLYTLRSGLQIFLDILPPAVEEQESLTPHVRKLKGQITILIHDLEDLEAVFLEGQLEEHINRLEQINTQLDELQATIEIFANIPPESIVSPLQANYQNVRGKAYSLVIYFAPSVLSLLIQHLSVTLGALALVHERRMGAFELYRVAPLKMSHLMLGKTLAYTLYVLTTTGTLMLLLRLLNVPILGEPLEIIGLILLLTLASLGVGFLISAVSTTDSQAVQLTMIFLLLSIFFTGFFLPLKGFVLITRMFSLVLPMTHGLSGLQALLLLGLSPGPVAWASLAIIGITAYGLTLLATRRFRLNT